jgi:hypothetical protein
MLSAHPHLHVGIHVNYRDKFSYEHLHIRHRSACGPSWTHTGGVHCALHYANPPFLTDMGRFVVFVV